jgi:hypothetical protein
VRLPAQVCQHGDGEAGAYKVIITTRYYYSSKLINSSNLSDASLYDGDLGSVDFPLR